MSVEDTIGRASRKPLEALTIGACSWEDPSPSSPALNPSRYEQARTLEEASFSEEA
jgi:hypothetical protein